MQGLGLRQVLTVKLAVARLGLGDGKKQGASIAWAARTRTSEREKKKREVKNEIKQCYLFIHLVGYLAAQIIVSWLTALTA